MAHLFGTGATEMAPLIENASGEDLIKHRDMEGGSLGMVAEEGGTKTERVSAYDRSQNQSKDRGLSSFERDFLVGFFICALCFFVIRFLYLYPAEYGTIIFSVLIGFHICSLCAEKTESDGMTARDWMVYLGVVRDHSQVDIPSLKGNTTPPTLHTASLKETLDQRDAYLMAQINALLRSYLV
jgi:hypothetical protein